MIGKINRQEQTVDATRARYLVLFFLLLAGWIIVRLFILQVLNNEYYSALAFDAHEIYQQLRPERGNIYFQDSRTGEEFPAAINREYYRVYAVPKDVPDDKIATTALELAQILEFNDEQKDEIEQKLSKRDDPYEIIGKKISADAVTKLKEAKLAGISFVTEDFRYYPEKNLAAAALGFTGFNEQGEPVGRYGIEGYWERELAGEGGFLSGEKGALGGWIALAGREGNEVVDGADLLLTIDRALQYESCLILQEGLKEYEAKRAELVIINPNTGEILTMCSLPDFDANNYAAVTDLSVFNNDAIFTPYEPGSVFKVFTMAAGLDLNLISPSTKYTDPCLLVINGHPLRNADHKCFGEQTMTQVLEESINTGAAWVQEKIGNDRFKDYLTSFGFGQKTGIELSAEAPGDISSLNNKGQIYGANASFGQGLTATPIQLAAAVAAVANGGKLLAPQIVKEVRFSNGKVERLKTRLVGQPISERAAKLLTGMMVSVVEESYRSARIKGYYVAGKTGTAQIPEGGGYSATRTNHSIVGFAPADDPQFVIIVKFEEPARAWAASTAAPVFGKIMKFALDYYGVSGERR